MNILNIISLIISTVGIVIICWGSLIAVFEFLRIEYNYLKHTKRQNQHELRRHLGSYILLGLEFMIAGDIVHTIVKPNKESLILLGSIVAIRTVIGYFLNMELKNKI